MRERTFRHTLHACYMGSITLAVVANLAPLLFVVFQKQYAISFTQVGSLVLVNFLTQLVVDGLSIRFVDRIGLRRAILLAHLLVAVGLVALGVLPFCMPPYAGILFATVIFASGGGLLEVLVSMIVDSIPSEARASTMSLSHSFSSWGQVGVVLISTLLLSVIVDSRWPLLPVVWAILPLINFFNFLRVPMAAPAEAEQRMPMRKLLTSRLFLLAMLLMLCSGAAEQSMGQWASLFAEKGLGISKTWGDLAGPCMFAAMMGIGRTVYGIYGKKIRLRRALGASAILSVISYAMAALIPNPALSLFGCALCGLSVSLMWPGMISLSAQGHAGGGTALFAVLALCGDLGCSFGPWLTGVAADAAQKTPALLQWGGRFGMNAEQTALRSGLFTAILFPLMMLFGILLYQRWLKKEQNQVSAVQQDCGIRP